MNRLAMSDSFDKLRAMIEDYRARGLLERGLDLLRWYVGVNKTDVQGWSLLAGIARDQGEAHLELSARFEVARLQGHGKSAEWLELSKLASSVGEEVKAVDARLRAAAALADAGAVTDAAALCDAILAEQPEHEEARSIRDRLPARPPDRESGAEDHAAASYSLPERIAAWEDAFWQDEDEALETMVFSGQPRTLSAELETDQDEPTGAEWAPPAPDLGSEIHPTHARFVCSSMPWPSALDQSCLMFLGNIDEIAASVASQMETVTLAADSIVYGQGRLCQLLYCVEEGKVQVVRYRDGFQDFGTIGAGSFFGEVGTIAGVPSSSGVMTVEASVLRILNRDKLRARNEDRAVLEPLVRSIRDWYLEAAVDLCPLFKRCTEDELRAATGGTRWVTLNPGARLAQQSRRGPLQMIVMGVARVTCTTDGQPVTLGLVTTGDLAGEMDPSPVTVTAESVVSAMIIDRDVVGQLPDRALVAFRAHLAACERVLREDQADAPPAGRWQPALRWQPASPASRPQRRSPRRSRQPMARAGPSSAPTTHDPRRRRRRPTRRGRLRKR